MALVCEPALALPEHPVQRDEFIAALRQKYAEQDDQLERKLALIRHHDQHDCQPMITRPSLLPSDHQHIEVLP
jgi:hypothetical protein